MSETQTPLTIISGFLGAGKTTLLNRILKSGHGMRIALIVNDFGVINIDSELIANVDEEKVTLSDGCICCSIRGTLYNTVVMLLEESQPPEYIVIEASGVADPNAILSTLMAPMLRKRLRIDSLVTVIDAPQVRETSQSNTALIKQQITAANMILLNKCDQIKSPELGNVTKWLQEIAPDTPVIETTHCDVPISVIFASLDPGNLSESERSFLDVHVHHIEESAPGQDSHGKHSHDDHSIIFDTCHFESDVPLVLSKVREWLKGVGREILRAKGFVVTDSGSVYLLNIVGRWKKLERYRPINPVPITKTRLVFIGKQGEVAVDDIRDELTTCRKS